MRTYWALALAIPVFLGACKSKDEPLDVSVDWSATEQTMDGFGASSAFFGDNIPDTVADQLFDAKKGIGLSLLRIMIGLPDDTLSDGSEPTENPNPVATAPELYTARQARVRGAKVWATAWTPPPIWKTTNSKNGKGDGFDSNKLDPAHYQDYATYLADFVELAKKGDIPLEGVSPANEPDYIASWDDSQWSPDELTTFVGKYLGPTFKDRCPSVKIITPDTASWPNVDSYVTALLADPDARNALSVVATHPYQNGNAPIVLDYHKPQENGKQFWETEWSQENMQGDTPDPGMTSAIDMMKHIHDHLTIANMTAWNWWAIYISADALKSADPEKVRQNPALVQPDKDMGDAYMFKRGYALGNWAKFVRPGFQRIHATDHPAKNVLIEAYRDDANHIALIAINTGEATVTQNFLIDGHAFGTLTPWITSPDDNLAAKGAFDGGNSFTYDLPGQSVTTFVNWDATQETPKQGTLPVLTMDAGTRPAGSGLDCSNAIVPNNGGNGGVTDFSDWKASKWGDPASLYGYMYSYQGPSDSASKMSAGADATAKQLHVTGSVYTGGYGGAGISFAACATVESFTQVQFTLSGANPGCDMELQLKTFEQQPSTQNPAGGCDESAGSCYNFPVVKRVAVPSAETTTVVVPLDSFTTWSTEKAKQVVGMQWQWTANADLDPDPDAGGGCPIDVTISDIKFLP